jgi:hypothetical protein
MRVRVHYRSGWEKKQITLNTLVNSHQLFEWQVISF